MANHRGWGTAAETLAGWRLRLRRRQVVTQAMRWLMLALLAMAAAMISAGELRFWKGRIIGVNPYGATAKPGTIVVYRVFMGTVHEDTVPLEYTPLVPDHPQR